MQPTSHSNDDDVFVYVTLFKRSCVLFYSSVVYFFDVAVINFTTEAIRYTQLMKGTDAVE